MSDPSTPVAAAPHEATSSYSLRISRLTIDKLGVKLYDKVSAAVAELIANSYDADAEEVVVELPLATELATLDRKTKEIEDHGYAILVRDNGHGMTPKEAQDFYLQVGRDRRTHAEQGGTSRGKHRPVMGRKGIGKLAPFGICQLIEVISSGGDPVPGKGYLTTHFFLDYGKIVQDSEEEVLLDVGAQDGQYAEKSGTTIRLSRFLPKRVPNEETFHRQIATRFALASPDFVIKVHDTRTASEFQVEQFRIDVEEATRIDVSTRPVQIEDDQSLPVTGWLAMAKESYKTEEGAGVRIYARNKIVATTRDFEQPAGFTGEFYMRSYLVGEVHADWLDEDEGEDLIRTDRQSILWDSEYGQALRAWGATLIKQIAAASAKPRRDKKSKSFMAKANIEERAIERYGDDEVARIAVELGKQIGAFAAEDELEDQDYVDGLAEVVLSVAPHQALVAAFQQISQKGDSTVKELLELFGKARIAELASYSQIADERVRSIKELQAAINKPDVQEADLQRLIASAPWLIRPDWSVITQNRSLKVFRDQFVVFYEKQYGEQLEVAISKTTKRPDFTLVHHGQQLHVVEIKSPGHSFDGADYTRLQNYVTAFDAFFDENAGFQAEFPERWQIDLIADGETLTDSTQRYAFDAFKREKKVVRQTWNDFLAAAVTAHQQFLAAHDQAHPEEEAE
ncbi:MAG: ATP-binding protein [Acidimicrobiales bacterium]